MCLGENRCTLDNQAPQTSAQYMVQKRIGIIGAGVVGTATGKGLSALGHYLTFYDISRERIDYLKSEGHNVVRSVKEIVSQNDISFVCVNTPTKGGRQDLSQLLSVLVELAKAIDSVRTYHLVVFRSSTVPGTMRDVVTDYLDRHCSRIRGRDYNICYNPEFLRQNRALQDFLTPDRVVIGEDIEGSSDDLKHIYSKLTDQIIICSLEAAEMIKYASNCFLALKISYFNEIGLLCRKMEIDDTIVSRGVSLDKRIGAYGTKIGKPFGGACLPKDTEALATRAEEIGITPDLLKVTLEINRKVADSSSKEKPAAKVEGIRSTLDIATNNLQVK